MEASKVGEENWSMRPRGPRPAAASAAASLPVPRCGTPTPLGRPVEPEVKIT
jgi:hypothetical protein